MDDEQIMQKLSKKFFEVCRAGILMSSYGVSHAMEDDSLTSRIASEARKEICKGRGSSSDLIGILDTSLRSNGSAGFAFSVDTLYCNCFENRDSNFSIKYADIDQIEYDNSDEDDVFIEIHSKYGSSHVINIGAFSKKKMKMFLDYAMELYSESNDDELDWDKL